MEVAILVFGIIAAIAAVAAVVVPLWRGRDRLELTFGVGFGSSGTSINLPCRVENAGRSTIYNIELFSGPPGITLNRPPIVTVNLKPRTSHDFRVDLGRPDGAEVEPGDTTPTLKAPQLIIAHWGRRLTVTEMPAGRYDPARAKTKTRWRRKGF